MAYFEGSYRQNLFGVSQQVPKDRLDWQVNRQVNMVSDLTTGPRRRAPLVGSAVLKTYTDLNRLVRLNTQIGGRAVVLVVDTVDGSMVIADELTGAVLQSIGATPYLVTTSAADIRGVTLDDTFILVNTSVKPTEVTSPAASSLPDVDKRGYFFVLAGAYSKQFTVTITDKVTGTQYSATHTTPNGTDPSHAGQSTPEAVAAALRTALLAVPGVTAADGFTYERDGAYVYIKSTTKTIAVSSSSGSNYISTSGASLVRNVSQLPALLPTAEQYIMAVGTDLNKVYYRWVVGSQSWQESAASDAWQYIANIGMRLSVSGGVYSLMAMNSEVRASGDPDNNPTFAIVRNGITGVGALQGRLVLLSNEYVCLSETNNPLRWYRGTVVSVLDTDPIEIAGTAALTSPYQYAIPFNKDLVLFAERHQGIVPGTQVVTSRNALVANMSSYVCQLTCSPAMTGRSVFYPAPRSVGYSGMWEMTPSPFSDLQLQSDDVSNHIPRYITGDVRFVSASLTSNIVVVGHAGDMRRLVVHEYLWQGSEKVHSAWHEWTFLHPVLSAYFVGDKLVCLFGVASEVVHAVLDLRLGAGEAAATTPRLDFQGSVVTSVAGQITLSRQLWDQTATGQRAVFKLSGAGTYMRRLISEDDVISIGPTNVVLAVDDAEVGDGYAFGVTYTSVLGPTQPIVKDRNEVAITTARMILHQLTFTFENTGEITATVRDIARGDQVYVATPLRLYSQELGVGEPMAADGQVYVPCRVDMQTADISVETSDVYDMNLTSLEYGYRYVQRHRR